MKTLTITPEQEAIIIDALKERIAKLYLIADSYKGNAEAVKDCMAEKNKVQDTLAEIRRQMNK